MITYRDMTFCPYWQDCAKSDCGRALTGDVQRAATEAGLPVCRDIERPECFVGFAEAGGVKDKSERSAE